MENYRPARVQSSSSMDAGLRSYMLKVYNYMALAVGITALFSWLVFKISVVPMANGALALTSVGSLLLNPIFGLVLFFVAFGVVFYLSRNVNRMSLRQAQLWTFAYSAILGVAIAGNLVIYTGASVTRVFLITAVSFGALSLYGYTTKRDLTAMGSFMVMGVVGLFLAMIVNMFLRSPALYFALSVLGVLIFAGLTAWDTQRVKSMYYMGGVGGAETSERKAILGALTLYIDFLNMFLFLLNLFGARR